MRYTNKARLNFFKKVIFYFISFVLFYFLFLTSSSFGFPEIANSKRNESHFPPLSLIGVMVTEDTSSSVAILKNEKTGKTIMLSIGEKILDLKLIHVFENRIILQKDEKTFQILLGRSNLISADKKLQKNSEEISVTDRKNDLLRSDQLNNNLIKIEFIRSEVERRIVKEWLLIIKETQFVPNYVDGKIRGFKITKLPEKSIISKIGIYKNDVIKEINGVELKDVEILFYLFNKFKNENRFEVSIERNGKSFHLLYILK